MDEPEIPPEQLDSDAVRVVTRLKQHGFEAYMVGGCVRDLLLGRVPKDFDIATSAHPNQVKELFRNSRLIGRRFRLAQVYFKGGKILEVSTFRKNPTDVEEAAAAAAAAPPEPDTVLDLSTEAALQSIEGDDVAVAPLAVTGANGDFAELHEAAPTADAEAQQGPDPVEAEEAIGGGVPDDDVFITQDNVFGTAFEDARRRDFTINGLFYDAADGKVTDYVFGLRDLANREIRTIGDPEVRMREDPVRLLRAVRFACKLEFDIESRTYAAMEGAVEDLVRCSPPRLLEETFRLIRGGVASGSLKLLRALDALKVLLPPVDEYLVAEGPEAEEELFDFAAALDERVLAGDTLDDSMMLAALLLPLSLNGSQPAASEQEATVVARPIETLLRELVRTARLPRRIAERTRMLLLAQPTLAGERRRRGGLVSFRRHPLFAEALKVFEIWVEATGEKREALAAWKSGGAPVVAAGAPGPRKRRRRRSRNKGGEAPSESTPETA
ncbi:MAG: poly(A) polymerase [Archangiaceae bacterium]|nr:poly(A) polymerase [Archangiaceae bacterium]